MSTDTAPLYGNTWSTDMTTDVHELDNLDLEIVPNEEPPHPKAVQWIETAYANENSHGELPIADDAQYERVRGYLRRAADHLGYSVTVKTVKDKKDKTIGLSFTVGQRRGRKTN